MNSLWRFSLVSLFALIGLLASASESVNAQRIVPNGKSISVPAKKADLTASPLVTDDFSYAAGELLTSHGWSAHSGGGTNALTVVSPSLTYSGYPGSGVGNAVAMTTSGEDVNQLFASPVSSGSVYAAAMVNVSSSTTTGDYFFHFYINTSTFWGKVFVQKDATTENFAFGVSRNANAGTGAVYTGYTYIPGKTYLVIVKYTFVDGGTNNDTVELFINPALGGAEPTPTLTANDFTAADVASIPGIGIRQGGSTSASTQRIDGIRVGTSWADVGAGGGPRFQKANVDMNGDGRSDFLIYRDGGAAFAANYGQRSIFESRENRKLQSLRASNDLVLGSMPIEWWGKNNAAPGGTNVVWGEASLGDTPISADFDGDGADDVAIWRPGNPNEAAFFSINSSDLTYRVSAFGQTGDDPTIVGDYDGDGRDDDATFRCPPSPGQCYFFYRPSSNNPTNGIVYIPWGFGDDFTYFTYPGDFDGDGKNDFCLQAVAPSNPNQGVFLLALTATHTTETVYWGLSTDLLVPGDYDADGKTDFCVVRAEGGRIKFYILERDGGGTGGTPIDWGLASLDYPAPGDYDGDGRQDIAVQRWDLDTATFWYIPSGGGPYQAITYGVPGDVPMAAWQVK